MVNWVFGVIASIAVYAALGAVSDLAGLPTELALIVALPAGWLVWWVVGSAATRRARRARRARLREVGNPEPWRRRHGDPK